MSSEELRKKFLAFFQKNGHAIVPSSSLVPDDPSVLLTTAGMQQFKKYFTGELNAEKSFGKKSTVSVQKCFRTSDIEEVGDERHLTFFEMLGNFSFGGYFKKEAIQFAYNFVVKELGLKIDYVTVFAGEAGVPADEESEKIWKSLDSKITVKKFGRADNFWGPTGSEGPCGPTTEIYVNGIEIWNIVFNQYYQQSDKKLEPLPTPGIDTGMGLERLAMVVQGKKNIFETDLFQSFAFLSTVGSEDIVRRGRIIADHLRALTFLLADGVRPSNKGVGYILRRLLRRSFIQAKKLSLQQESSEGKIKKIIEQYGEFYTELKREKEKILDEFRIEAEKFNSTLDKGLKEFDRRFPGMQVQTIIPGKSIEFFKVGQKVGEDAFDLYQTYGFPIEDIKELLEERFYKFDESEFRKKIDAEFKKHQEVSRAGAEKKFGGHGLLLDTGEIKAKDEVELKKVTRLHTATHLLQSALRQVLGNEVKQMGSDITAERTRFDFTFARKLTPEEIKKTEAVVNEAIEKDLPVAFKEMPKDEAMKTGALFFFKAKYADRVKVYYMGHSIATAFSKEFCGGPHVDHTLEVGKFKIAKEEAVSSGVRRIRGVVEP